MKWYGNYKYNTIKSKLKISRKKRFIIKKYNPLSYFYKTILYLPNEWNLIIFKKKDFAQNRLLLMYLYSDFYFFFLPIFNKFTLISYDKFLKSLIIKFILKNNFFNLFFNYLKIIFFSFSKIFFRKIKFKGKGYYIYKNSRNTIALQFGYSHLLYLYSFFINVKFITKTSIILFGVNLKDLEKKTNELVNIKKINIFTSRGIRFAKQIIYKKTGKISSYR
jgi:hypothetical protein